MAYVEAHTSNAYDESCLRKFAAGLLAAGLQDEAATVFYGLLQRDGDRAQQVCQPPSTSTQILMVLIILIASPLTCL